MQNRASNVQKGRVISRRLFMLAAAKLLLFAGITSRLYNLQISDGEKYEILRNTWVLYPFSKKKIEKCAQQVLLSIAQNVLKFRQKLKKIN